MSRIAYFDCPSGISGDMTLGALIDAGADRAVLEGAVEALGLGTEVQLDVRREERGHLSGTRVLVSCGDGPHRNVPELERVLSSARLPAVVKGHALSALGRLAQAESAVHSRPPAELHLHELGGADTLVDLVGSFWLLQSLGVESVHASPLPAPGGPFTAPGTLRVLEATGAVLEPDDRHVELVTPTGAAILATVASFQRPAMTLERTGFGIGGRDLPGNAVAIWLGQTVPETTTVTMIETNLDDMPPNLLAALTEDLMAAGALDVTVVPALMKKGRAGHLLRVMAEPSSADGLARQVLGRSPTLGVRISPASRLVAGRRLIEVTTRWGSVRVKVKELDGRPVSVAPEYEDCRRLGGAEVALVMREATAAAETELGL